MASFDANAGLGRAGEAVALAWYRARGYRVVAANWRCALGELDLVLEHDRTGTLVFCEVKARRGVGFGGPFEAVTAAKRRKLRALAEAFMLESRRAPERVRFDVASVLVGGGSGRVRPPGSEAVHVFEDAF
jgi:putative endonuclease